MQWDAPFTPADILYLLGYNPTRQTGEASFRCPFHNDKGKHLWVNLNKGTFKCQHASCGESGGMIQFYSRLTNQSSKDAYKDIMNRLNLNLSQSDISQEKKKVHQALLVKETPKRNPAEKNAVYVNLLNSLQLNNKHYSELINVRGLSDSFIRYRNYKSIPTANLSVCCKILLDLGYNLKGIPGFHRNTNGIWEINSKYGNGLLIPIININGYLVGFQIKLDNPRTFVNGKKEPKYIWLSSKPGTVDGYTCGTAANSEIHFSSDFQNINGTLYPKIKNFSIAVTEGPLKADIFHHLTGQNVVAVPGVNALAPLMDVIPTLKQLGVTTIYNCFDMDFFQNEAVMKQMNKLNKFCVNQGIKVIRPVWDAEFKGIDDYYLFKVKGIKKN